MLGHLVKILRGEGAGRAQRRCSHELEESNNTQNYFIVAAELPAGQPGTRSTLIYTCGPGTHICSTKRVGHVCVSNTANDLKN